MSEAAQAFAQILERENLAARKADVDALVSLQDEKRALMSRLEQSETPEGVLAELRARAHHNIQLMRHLTQCLQGMLAPQGATYNAGGSRPMGAVCRSWGRL